MKIIPLMVVLICASGRWHHGPSALLPWMASALEVRIPLLGRMKMEFIPDKGLGVPPNGSTTQREPTTAEGKEEPTEVPAKGSEAQETTKAKDDKEPAKTTQAKAKEKPTEAPTAAPGANATTIAKDEEQTTQKTDKEPAETTQAKEQPTQAPNAATKAKETTSKPDSPAVKEKPTEAPAKQQPEATTATESKANQPTEAPAVPMQTTEQPEPDTDAANDPDDDFDDSDIWDDTEDPPKEFGREYDLDPKLLHSDGAGHGLGDFLPKLHLPPNMLKDMFFNSPAADKPSDGDQEDDSGGIGIFGRIKRFFSIANIKEELDTIPGKVQALMDQFRQKKSVGLKKLKETLDNAAEKVGQKITEVFSKLKAPKPSHEQCLGQLEEQLKQYEEALQGGIQPCLDKMQSLATKQEGVLRTVGDKFTRMLANMQDCVGKLDSFGSLVKSFVNMGSCTKKNIQSQIEESLQPQMNQLTDMLQQQSSKLNRNLNATELCVERQLQLPKFQKLEQELAAKGEQCLEKSD